MKTIKKSVIFVISCIFAAVSFTACTADDDIIVQAPTFINNQEYPVSDVKVTASGIVSVETKKDFTRGNGGELKPEDFNIRQLSASEAEINMLALFAHAWSQNALVVVPDYEGYGSTAGIPHPYCNRELTAEQVVTGAKAGLSYYENNVTKMDPKWSGVAIGYSQGGAVAAGTAFFLDYCGNLVDEILKGKWAPREETVGGRFWKGN